MPSPDHWQQHARQWAHIGPPLRPCAEDIRLLESCLHARLAAASLPRHALLLGVTPEIAQMRWADDIRLVAADRSPEMIRGVWPDGRQQHGNALCADWQRLPFAARQFCCVVGDGCFTLLDYRRQYRDVAREIHRVLAAGGLLLMRFFLRQEIAESPGQVFADLQAGEIASFHAFKWRLAQSLHGTIEEGVEVARVWDAWQAAGIDSAALAARTGWSVAAIDTINAYRGAPARYTFPTLPEVRAAFAGIFIERDCLFGRYELAGRCPTLVLAAA